MIQIENNSDDGYLQQTVACLLYVQITIIVDGRGRI